ncbi:MAG: Gfo/Idh/MocA family protein [Armatimonadota bacterium]
MSGRADPLPVLVVGGGMISHDVILPTLFQEQDDGSVGEVSVASRRAATIQGLRDAFGRTEPPDEPHEFSGHPDPDQADDLEKAHPEAYRDAIAGLPTGSAVIVATPDDFHTPVALAAIEAGHHVLVEKPLCLKVAEAHQIIAAAEQEGVLVQTDYHKRYDRANRAIMTAYRRGELGQPLAQYAKINERKEIPEEVFRRWCERSSPFEYIGVHYADIYYFITGLRPKRVMATGQKRYLVELGIDAYDAVQAHIVWEDGSASQIATHWVSPRGNTALTDQFVEFTGTRGVVVSDHKDRGTSFCTDEAGYRHVNPNFFRGYVDTLTGKTRYEGYGYDSIVQFLRDVDQVRRGERTPADFEGGKRPTARDSLVGTAINEAVRLSLENGSQWVGFGEGMQPALV